MGRGFCFFPYFVAIAQISHVQSLLIFLFSSTPADFGLSFLGVLALSHAYLPRETPAFCHSPTLAALSTGPIDS